MANTVPKQSRGYLSLGFLSKAASLYHHAHAAGRCWYERATRPSRRGRVELSACLPACLPAPAPAPAPGPAVQVVEGQGHRAGMASRERTGKQRRQRKDSSRSSCRRRPTRLHARVLYLFFFFLFPLLAIFLM
jgi:hypothetical protein